jgi:hypothetical protein
VYASIGAGVVIVIIGVIVCIFFAFIRSRSGCDYSESIEEKDEKDEKDDTLQSTDIYDQGDDDHEYENVLSADAHASQRTGEIEEGTFHSRICARIPGGSEQRSSEPERVSWQTIATRPILVLRIC